MTTLQWILLIVCVCLVICPTKYDPAIRFKEWIEGKRKDDDNS